MAMTKEALLRLPYDEGKVYAIGDTPSGVLVATGTLETAKNSEVLVTIAKSGARPVPLESFIRFQVPIEFYDEPKQWMDGDE